MLVDAGSLENDLRAPEEQNIGSKGTPTDNALFPDGGLQAWTTVGGCWLVLFATFGYLNSFGIYQDFYTRVYLNNYSPSVISWIGSFQLMMPFALGLVTGKLFDVGYFYAVEIFGSILFTCSLFLLSLAQPHNYPQIFLCQGLGMGVGIGFTFVPTVSVVSHHFKRHRGLASGIALSGTAVGAVIFPIMLNHLIPSIGFSKAVRATAYIVTACLIVGNCLIRTRPSPKSNTEKESPPTNIKSFFKDAPYMWTVLGTLTSLIGFSFPLIYLQFYAIQHNVDPHLAFYSIAILNGCGVLGRILGNFLADIYGPYNIHVPCTLLTGATIWAILGVHDVKSLFIVSVVYGIFSGAWLSVAIMCISSHSRSQEEVGARTGLALAFGSLGSLCSGPAQGSLLTGTFLWLRPVAFSGGILMASSFIFLISRVLLTKRLSSKLV